MIGFNNKIDNEWIYTYYISFVNGFSGYHILNYYRDSVYYLPDDQISPITL